MALASTWRQGGRGMQGTLSLVKTGAQKLLEPFRPTRPSASAPPKPPAVSLSLSAAQPDSRQLGRARDAVHVGFVLQAARAKHRPARATSACGRVVLITSACIPQPGGFGAQHARRHVGKGGFGKTKRRLEKRINGPPLRGHPEQLPLEEGYYLLKGAGRRLWWVGVSASGLGLGFTPSCPLAGALLQQL